MDKVFNLMAKAEYKDGEIIMSNTYEYANYQNKIVYHVEVINRNLSQSDGMWYNTVKDINTKEVFHNVEDNDLMDLTEYINWWNEDGKVKGFTAMETIILNNYKKNVSEEGINSKQKLYCLHCDDFHSDNELTINI